MVERLLIMYYAYMIYGTTGLIPHMVGPPGSGKSTFVKLLGEILGVKVHIISVARLNPMESEGVQMAVDVDDDMILKMLPAEMWTRIEEGDIVFFDEFLRGFEEVYNALLDIFTSRKVGRMTLPRVFMVAASNSIATYDDALKDRLLPLPVDDPRKKKTEYRRIVDLMIDELGLDPEMKDSLEMSALMEREVLPMYDVMDQLLKSRSSTVGSSRQDDGRSVRNLISQVQLRTLQSTYLKALVEENNRVALAAGRPQYVIMMDHRGPREYVAKVDQWLGDGSQLTQVQQRNLLMNRTLIELAEARKEKMQ